ncbi:hypothetical protein FOMG_17844 [Fusarium oxysporum f. sp. melonis 26406]|uniref:Uncharacterized protein n=1 Tax=Fusarium oxysporum f. sp. melonis 26406 TaxID=1089452 RepID=W9Z2C8_FUSOX|nr:hypothetical protein FOMG_17844 [Fusarium oxysporum f. sp. melonis 26406]
MQCFYHQVVNYTNSLNALKRDFKVEELAGELSSVAIEGVWLL